MALSWEQAAIAKGEYVLTLAGYEDPQAEHLTEKGFLHWAKLVADAARDVSRDSRLLHGLQWDFREWLEDFNKLYYEFDRKLQADPMMAYRPAHRVSEAFHSSNAFIRYFMAGNRTSKTQTGYAEHYLVVTNQHQWRHIHPGAHTTFLIGPSYSKYGPGVYERKFLTGEEGNPLSPMFPEGGKWFHSYDKRKCIIYIACTNCAEAGKAQSCTHRKSSITLFSDEGGFDVLQGRQDMLGHFDENIDESFYEEAKQRLSSVIHDGKAVGKLIVTGTPLFGEERWEIRRLKAAAEGPEEDNRKEDGTPIVEMFCIDQFEAGIVPHDQIRQNMFDMDEFEIEARVYGRPSPLAKKPVFDRKKLAAMREKAFAPRYARLKTDLESLLELTADDLRIDYYERVKPDWTGLRIWEEPKPDKFYIAAVDTATGLYRGRKGQNGDASACSVFKVEKSALDVKLTMVAQFHGWINMLDYGDEVFKICHYYNEASAVVERTGGYGAAVISRLKKDLCYWNIYAGDKNKEAIDLNLDSRYGVDTNAVSKPFMVSACQNLILKDLLIVPCKATIAEMVAFEQEDTTNGGRKTTAKYRGAGGAKDDRVMSCVIAAGVVAQDDFTGQVEGAEEQYKSKFTQKEASWNSQYYY